MPWILLEWDRTVLHTKECLADVLRMEDWHAILLELGDLPSYAIGGIGPGDLASVSALGANGVAVCSSVICEEPNQIIENYQSLAAAWDQNKGAIIC